MSESTTANSAPSLLSRFLNTPLKTLLRWGLRAAIVLLLLAIAGFALFVFYPNRAIPPLEAVDEYVYLDQGWGRSVDSSARQTYYYTPQGTSVPQGAQTDAMRYRWFVNLEMPFSTQRFAAPEHLRRYRFIVDPQPSGANPDQLPLGFAKHYEPTIGEDVLDITCAACHSGEIHVEKNGKRVAVRIDGGQAMHAFTDMQRGSFAPTLVASMIATYSNPMKFNRFARKVIGARYPEGKSALRKEFFAVLSALLTQGQNNPLRQLYPVAEGYGRTDALGRIANTVFGDHLSASNYREAIAPVSYPYVWNIWKFDWVQYNGSVRQPLARNIGEALGVGAVIRMTDTVGNPLPPEHRFDSSVMIENLQTIEHTLQSLTPPKWPEDLMGSVDRGRAAQGKELFEHRCQMCHGPHVASAAFQQASAPQKPSADVEWRIEVIPLNHIGTDPVAASAFVEQTYDLSASGITPKEIHQALHPLLTRNLARDVRYRLIAVSEERHKQNLPLGDLAKILANYPDPDQSPTPSLPLESFKAIADAMRGLDIPMHPEATRPPDYGWECGLDCQQHWLAWNVSGADEYIDQQLRSLDIRKLHSGEGLNLLGLMIKAKYYRDEKIDYATQQCLEGFGALDLPQQIAGYKPRPLQGVWATPPFLHNGSVPSIYQMLLPPEQRTVRFSVGRRDYDTKHLGFFTEAESADMDAGFWLDTTKPGNRNTGHAFVATPEQWAAHEKDPKANPLPPGVIGQLLSDEERFAILEYLKIHEDLPATPADFVPPDCSKVAATAVNAVP